MSTASVLACGMYGPKASVSTCSTETTLWVEPCLIYQKVRSRASLSSRCLDWIVWIATKRYVPMGALTSSKAIPYAQVKGFSSSPPSSPLVLRLLKLWERARGRLATPSPSSIALPSSKPRSTPRRTSTTSEGSTGLFPLGRSRSVR